MKFFWTCFTTIAFCLASIMLQSFGELIVLRHPPDDDRSERKLTCVSEDDGAALIWNYDTNSTEIRGIQGGSADFLPKMPTSQDTAGCGIWGSTQCLVEWGDGIAWELVESATRPMGPVLDYRWEGFKEFSFEQRPDKQGYQRVGKVEISGTAVFSARGQREIQIFLCDGEEPTTSRCFLIILGKLWGNRFEISTCLNGAPDIGKSTNRGVSCALVNTTTNSEKILNAYEWHTFTLKWNRDTQTIQVFTETDPENKPFLQGSLARWLLLSYISVRSVAGTRVRFHSYQYYWTERYFTPLATKDFDHSGGDLCLELLVGLCSECKLRVDLTDTNNTHHVIDPISGGKHSVYNELLTWQLVKVNTSIGPQKLRLNILHTLKQRGRGKGREWAIGGIRTCKSVGASRESTVTIPRDTTTHPPTWPKVICQGLSYGKTTVVDSVSTTVIERTDQNKLEQLVKTKKVSCGSTCANLGKTWSYCYQNGCTCDRGFWEVDCDLVCDGGTSGYHCENKCRACKDGLCDTATGYCSGSCKNESLLPPRCEKVFETPIIDSITDSTAKVLQTMELETNTEANLYYSIKKGTVYEQLVLMKRTNTDSSMYEALITNLQPDIKYYVYTVATINIIGSKPIHVTSQATSFQTTSRPKPIPEKVSDIKKIKTFPRIDGVPLQWEPSTSENGKTVHYNVTIKLVKLLGCVGYDKPIPVDPPMVQVVTSPTASFNGLRPYAQYKATIVAYTTVSGKPNTIDFQTYEESIPTSSVSKLRLTDNKRILVWDEPADCTEITGQNDFKRLNFTCIDDSGKNSKFTRQTSYNQFDLSKIDKQPSYTRCTVRIYVMRKATGKTNSTNYKELEFTTLPFEPTTVINATIYEADPDRNTFSLRWIEPDPANGEIEFYFVIVKGNQTASYSKTVRSLEQESNCEKNKGYVCFRDITLPPYVTANNTQIEIYATNKDVDKHGASSPIPFVPNLYFKAPSRPLNLTAIPEAYGILNLKWHHPSVSYIKIVRFHIKVEFIETKLLENIIRKFPTTKDYRVSEEKNKYSTMLYLPTSTTYRIFVTAVNENNSNSTQAQVITSTSAGVAFESGGELLVSQKGNLIELTVPDLVNATKDTLVLVMVEGVLTCPHKQSPRSPSISSLTVREYKPESRKSKLLTIDANDIHGDASNCSLDLGKNYKFTVATNDSNSTVSNDSNSTVSNDSNSTVSNDSNSTVSNDSNSTVSNDSFLTVPTITTIVDEQVQKTNLAWLGIFPILAICLLFISFIWYRNRKRVPSQPREPREPSYVVPNSLPVGTISRQATVPIYTEVIPPMLPATSTNNAMASNPSNNPIQHLETADNGLSAHVYALPNEPDSCLIDIEDFEKYAKEAATSGWLYSQFALLRSGLTKPSECGRLPGNVSKNRCIDLIPYDENRVVLEEIPGRPYSDYINASYIKGYEKEKAYIAAQGPMPNTVDDFWRMVWQEEVRVICMLTDVVEGTEKLCEKYWPDVGTGMKCGNFYVSNKLDQVYADYTFRTFELSYLQATREVTHLHYTGWPSLGVPTYPQSLIAFVKKLEKTPAGNGPVVVHCSTGDERTGTIILCDICLRKAVAEEAIDVTAVITRMRDSRANMVGNLQQYVLAHVIIAESLASQPTQIPCAEVLSSRMNKLRIQLQSDIRRLDDTKWQQEVLRSLAAQRHPDGLEVTYDDVFANESHQINPVSVDGVKVKEQYLTCWLPSLLTLRNFWTFVAERNIKLIVILQCSDPRDPTCCDIVPDKSFVVPDVRVENKTSFDDRGEYFTSENLLLTDTLEENARSQSVTVLTCKGWACGTDQTPPTPAALVSLWTASEKISRKGGKTLVLCHDGVTGCGLYLALSFLLERMAVERECDVISAVRAVRRSRPEFVRSVEQFEYLYDAAVNYVECFRTYANFS